MTDTEPRMKHYDWTELKGKAIEARIFCPKCQASKVIEGYSNAFWLASNANLTCQCDKCRSFISLKIHKGGVEVMA